MAKHSSGAFGSRKGIPQKPVRVQANTLQFGSDPAPWFADFDRLHAEANALTTSAGMVLPYVQNGELLAKIDRSLLNNDVQGLTNHVAAMKGRLALLKQTGEELRTKVTRITVEVVPELLEHAESYQLFMNDWTRIVLFAVDNVLEHFRVQGEEIPYVCPFHPGFKAAVAASQMNAAQFEQATTPMTMEDMEKEVNQQ